jgi:hypothetical protein
MATPATPSASTSAGAAPGAPWPRSPPPWAAPPAPPASGRGSPRGRRPPPPSRRRRAAATGRRSSLRRRWGRRVRHPARRSPDLAALVPVLVVPPFDLRAVGRARRCPDDDRLGGWPTGGLGQGTRRRLREQLVGRGRARDRWHRHASTLVGEPAPRCPVSDGPIDGAGRTWRCTTPAVRRPEAGGRLRRQAGQQPWRRADRGGGTPRTIIRFAAGR